MAEYIEKKKLVNALKMWLMDLENDMNKGDYGELCENKGAREAVESCICEAEEQPAADVQPVDRWISVKDRLPEIIYNSSEDVLIHLKNGEQYVAIYVDEDKDFGIEAYWSTSDMHKDFERSKVTHWQPLPELPKDGGVKNG